MGITETTYYTIEFSSGNVGVITAQANFAELLILLLLIMAVALMLVMVVRLWTLSSQLLSLSSSLRSLQMRLSALPEKFGGDSGTYDVLE